MDDDIWKTITISGVWFGLFACVWFVAQLQREAGWSWFRNPFGRFLMVRKLLLAALFAVVLLNREVPDWVLRDQVTALLMWSFAVHTLVPYRLLVRAQKTAVRSEGVDEGAADLRQGDSVRSGGGGHDGYPDVDRRS